MNLVDIKKPSLVIDKKKVINNIRSMKSKADNSHVIFRPHFKTHQSATIGEWFLSEGINRITVSSVSMANYFALQGWNDISIAFPLNIREYQDISSLTDSINLNVLISSEVHATFLSQKNKNPLGVFIKIDTGYHRAGLQILDNTLINSILSLIKKNKSLIFKGFIAHFGNTYDVNQKTEIIDIYQSGIYQLNLLKKEFINFYPDLLISIGDTPSCSLIEHFEGINEIRPGNFVYYDLKQLQLGACTEEQIAMAVACPVIDINKSRNEILIYGGAVHFSKDYITDIQSIKSFGSIVSLSEKGWGKSIPGAYLKNISQEHGIISIDPTYFDAFKIGGLIGVLPIHSCLTADLLDDASIIEN